MEEQITGQTVKFPLRAIRIPVANIAVVQEIAVAVMGKVINSILIPVTMILVRRAMEKDAVLIVTEAGDNDRFI
jgi:hypothetical protein